jgi:ferredoxin
MPANGSAFGSTLSAAPAFGFCAEFCPELFDLDEWGYAWLKERDAEGAAERLICETTRLCPRKAITIDETGVRPRAASEGS